MKKIILSAFMLISLSGCKLFDPIGQNPMGLLPPSAQYMLMTDQSNKRSNKSQAISIDDLLSKTLSNVESGSENSNDINQLRFPILLAYDDFIKQNYATTLLDNLKNHNIILACGTFSIGDPITAASNALKACSAIQRLFKDHNISFKAVFSPKDKADHVTIKLKTYRNDSHA